jgi:hypothetical protein
MGVVIGVTVGYALGSRAGTGTWSEPEEVTDLVSGGLCIARDVMRRRAEIIAGALGVTDDTATLRPAA